MSPSLPLASLPILHIDGGVATLTLNRPAQRNRLENADLKALLAHFDSVNRDASVRVLVLTANTSGHVQPVFCAGYDIGGFDEPGHGARFFEDIPDALATVRPVSICALNGSVYGGATDLALACDLRLGLQGTEWRMPATALGLHYYPSGLQRYVSRFGLAGAKRAFLTARPFTAQQLDAMGLFEALVGLDDWAAAQQALVQDILALAPQALQDTKKSLNDIEAGRADMAQLRQREQQSSQSADFAEGRMAFAQRRAPVFTGR
jgi:enoyl-CoA hydratase/carnithine racemase